MHEWFYFTVPEFCSRIKLLGKRFTAVCSFCTVPAGRELVHTVSQIFHRIFRPGELDHLSRIPWLESQNRGRHQLIRIVQLSILCALHNRFRMRLLHLHLDYGSVAMLYRSRQLLCHTPWRQYVTFPLQNSTILFNVYGN